MYVEKGWISNQGKYLTLYEQIDGVAMGSPLGPLLANVFMSSIEEKLDVEGKLPQQVWLSH